MSYDNPGQQSVAIKKASAAEVNAQQGFRAPRIVEHENGSWGSTPPAPAMKSRDREMLEAAKAGDKIATAMVLGSCNMGFKDMEFCTEVLNVVKDQGLVPKDAQPDTSFLALKAGMKVPASGDEYHAYTAGAVALSEVAHGFPSLAPKASRLPEVGDLPPVKNFVQTPYGKAIQSDAADARAIKTQIEMGEITEFYKVGQFGRSQTVDEAGQVSAQFWAPESPYGNPEYAAKYGVDFAQQDFTLQGRLNPGASFVTRPAPSLGANEGGAVEIVVPSGGMRLEAAITR